MNKHTEPIKIMVARADQTRCQSIHPYTWELLDKNHQLKHQSCSWNLEYGPMKENERQRYPNDGVLHMADPMNSRPG